MTIDDLIGRVEYLRPKTTSHWKAKKVDLSPILYAAAIALSFVNPGITCGLEVMVALVWLIPDRRMERVLAPE